MLNPVPLFGDEKEKSRAHNFREEKEKFSFSDIKYPPKTSLLRHIGLLEADEDKIQKIRPKGTLVTILYVPREAICPKGG